MLLGTVLFGKREEPGSAYALAMRVRVLFFGVLRDLVGVPERRMEVADGAAARDVVELCRTSGGSEALWRSIAVAVNQEYAGRERVLAEGDEVALLPPVSGGRELNTRGFGGSSTR